MDDYRCSATPEQSGDGTQEHTRRYWKVQGRKNSGAPWYSGASSEFQKGKGPGRGRVVRGRNLLRLAYVSMEVEVKGLASIRGIGMLTFGEGKEFHGGRTEL
ncbi:unnamed protein product [Calypogeia fissa]